MQTGTKWWPHVNRFLNAAVWIWFWCLNMLYVCFQQEEERVIHSDETAVSLVETKSVCGLFWPAGSLVAFQLGL